MSGSPPTQTREIRCLICGKDSDSRAFQAAEMMFRMDRSFEYFECGSCQSLQIGTIPDDLGEYYPVNYYSFPGSAGQSQKDDRIKARIQGMITRMRDRGHFDGAGPLSRMIAASRPFQVLQSLGAAGIAPGQRFLDVGCGAGVLLDRLARIGFRNLSGIDPFIPATFTTADGVHIRKCFLSELDPADLFDTILFNHSLEHVPDPHEELCQARKRLARDGRCVIRIPTPSSRAWADYGSDWVQLDAPRHISLPSRLGISELARRSGFELVKTIDDGTGFAFWGSELYRRGEALVDGKGHTKRATDCFDKKSLEDWDQLAARMNEQSLGDQATFVLQPR